jgi:hypothetical protein
MKKNLLGMTGVRSTELKFVSIIIATLLILTSIPYAFAYFSAPKDKQFMGFIINVEDHTQYLSWYKGFQSSGLISNTQTSEENPPIFFNLLWWMLAKAGQITGISYILIYQIFRWLACAFFLLVIYIFYSFIFTDIVQRKAVFLMTVAGSGLGWILVVLKYTLTKGEVPFPLDLYVAEGNSFLTLLGYPHFAEAAGLIVSILLLLLLGEQKKQLRFAVYAGLVALFLGLQHAYDLFIVWSIPCVYAAVLFFVERRLPAFWIKSMIIVGLISFPPALYSFLLTQINPIWKQVLAQFSNAGVYTPSPLHMLIFMGLPLVMALFTIAMKTYRAVKIKDSRGLLDGVNLFLLVWFVFGWLLTYIPTDFQIHMINSWQFPVYIWAAKGIFEYVIPGVSKRFRLSTTSIVVFIILLILPTTLYLYMWRFLDLNRHNYPYYITREEVKAMQWLETNTPPSAIILTSYNTGMYLPGLSDRRAFISHWAQTVNFLQKRELVQEIYNNKINSTDFQKVITQYGINYVVYGPGEGNTGNIDMSGTNLDQPGFLEEVYRTDHLQIYEVK